MMLLEIDAGNTRVKWRLVAERADCTLGCAAQGAFVMEENSRAWDEQFCELIGRLPMANSGRVLVSNVRGEGFEKSIRDYAGKVWGLVPEFAIPRRYCAGVTNGYDAPEKLGVDRWLAILATYNMVKTACCILNCGTTVTLDIVSEAGNHEGGYIIPGLQLMKHSLLNRSSALITHSECEPHLSPGHDTSSAILNGALNAIAGFATSVKSTKNLSKSDCVWVVSGGDGDLIRASLNWETRSYPSLVLDGLCLAIP